MEQLTNRVCEILAEHPDDGMLQSDVWKRLIRTLSLQNSVTFGTIEEADSSATRINKLHEVINKKYIVEDTFKIENQHKKEAHMVVVKNK